MNLYTVRKELTMGTPISNINLKVTYYSRVSTTNEEQKSSLENQQTYFEEMIKKNKNWEYVEGYIDEGITGTSDSKRTSFMKMIEDAKSNLFDLIITKEISRFSRNTLDSIKYTRELLKNGVGVLFINDNINTILPDSELRLTIMASLAQDEVRKLSDRVKFGMKASIKKGNILGNQRLYGYIKQEDKYVIVPKQREIIIKIYKLFATENKSLNEIARILKKESIKTNNNKYFHPTTIARLIRNPKYKGYYAGGKCEVIDYMTKKVELIPSNKWITYKDYDHIPPIVSDYLWNKANKRLNKID